MKHRLKNRSASSCLVRAHSGSTHGGRRVPSRLDPLYAPIPFCFQRALKFGLCVTDSLCQHFAQLSLRLWKLARVGFLPVCHTHHMGMREGELSPDLLSFPSPPNQVQTESWPWHSRVSRKLSAIKLSAISVCTTPPIAYLSGGGTSCRLQGRRGMSTYSFMT